MSISYQPLSLPRLIILFSLQNNTLAPQMEVLIQLVYYKKKKRISGEVLTGWGLVLGKLRNRVNYTTVNLRLCTKNIKLICNTKDHHHQQQQD
jgi:hypothetical protein